MSGFHFVARPPGLELRNPNKSMGTNKQNNLFKIDDEPNFIFHLSIEKLSQECNAFA
jgi:hypothetical protein